MTVIAWDGTTLAADKRACMGSLIRTTTKIHAIWQTDESEISLCGFTGDAAAGEELLEWYRRGAVADKFPEPQRQNPSRLIVVRRSGLILTFEATPCPVQFDAGQQFAVGDGRDFALAAMHCGKTAREAVEIAALFDNGCGNGVDELTFDT